MDWTRAVVLELDELERAPLGIARSAAVEQVVRRIETEGPAGLLARGYANLVRSYVWGGEVEKAFVPFTRWLRHYDEHPELFTPDDSESMFWSFRWMVSRCMDFPQVPFEQIEATLADMERRYAVAGLAMDAVRLDQFHWAWLQGSPETEQKYWEWVRTPRAAEDTCTLCDMAGEAHYLAETGRVAQAVERLARATNEPACESEPAGIMAQLAEYHLTLGDPEKAVRAYRACLRLLPSKTLNADSLGRIALFLARGGQPERALRRVEADQRLLLDAATPAERMYYLMHVAAAARLVALETPEMTVRLTGVPATTARELAAWSREEAFALAVAFDARNRGGQLAGDLAKELALERAPRPLDLSVLPPAPTPDPADPAAPGSAAPEVQETADLVARADRHVRRGQLLQAAPLYLEASTALRAAGDLVDAGLARANAARCAHELEDAAGADTAYREAIALLRAGGAPVAVASAVVRSWVPLALEVGSSTAALESLEVLRAEIVDLLADEDDRALRIELAESFDTHARARAAAGEADDAVRLALCAATEYRSLARTGDAAHSLWLAGRALREQGRDADAVEHLQDAVEGFALARRRELRGKVATDLVSALRALGRDADALGLLEG
ncbi:MAG: hypothetical protein GX593_11710 [Actinomycetales bacterium]|nr:hypothetical protein [Actinomycetales bacterium]